MFLIGWFGATAAQFLATHKHHDVLLCCASGAWSTTADTATPDPASGPGDATTAAMSPANPVDDGQAVGLRGARGHHLPDITLAALRYVRASGPTSPGSVDKRGAELLYRVRDLKKWARNRPRAASGITGLG
ncbi:hypothetical protein [Streptomyces sp. NPDC094472]|uniref:hypothetical protein n=1 Tax=unclassified Streptomyces TaxID=2593676 RepID=UPI003321C68D